MVKQKRCNKFCNTKDFVKKLWLGKSCWRVRALIQNHNIEQDDLTKNLRIDLIYKVYNTITRTKLHYCCSTQQQEPQTVHSCVAMDCQAVVKSEEASRDCRVWSLLTRTWNIGQALGVRLTSHVIANHLHIVVWALTLCARLTIPSGSATILTPLDSGLNFKIKKYSSCGTPGGLYPQGKRGVIPQSFL